MAQELTNYIPAFTAEAQCGYLGTLSAQGEIWERKKGIYSKIHCPGAPLVSPGEPPCGSPRGNQGWEGPREEVAADTPRGAAGAVPAPPRVSGPQAPGKR